MSSPNPNPLPENHTFAELVVGREDEFPLLARAAANAQQAYSFKVEWLRGPKGAPVHVWNYTQIVRWPYDGEPVEQGSRRDATPAAKDEALTRFLTACERILWDGEPTYRTDGGAVTSCGGVRHFLGRDPVDSDEVVLAVLRLPVYRLFTHDAIPGEDAEEFEWVARETPAGEWLAEFSLIVHPATREAVTA